MIACGAACSGWRVLVAALLRSVAVGAQMPDPRLMHGQVMPAGELPAGSVTVRVVRQTMAQHRAGRRRWSCMARAMSGARDDRHGAARSSTGCPSARACTPSRSSTASGSSPSSFAVPRVWRRAHDAGGGRRGWDARRRGATAGTPPAALRAGAERGRWRSAQHEVCDRVPGRSAHGVLPARDREPSGAAGHAGRAGRHRLAGGRPSGASLHAGASPLAGIAGPRVSIAGPFAPGVTQVPVAFRDRELGGRLELDAALSRCHSINVAVAAQQLSGMTLESPQATTRARRRRSGAAVPRRDGQRPGCRHAADGDAARIAASSRRSPLYMALRCRRRRSIVWGVWAGDEPRQPGRRHGVGELEARRRRGLAALAALDEQARAGTIDVRSYADKRASSLLRELERVYRALDATGDRPAVITGSPRDGRLRRVGLVWRLPSLRTSSRAARRHAHLQSRRGPRAARPERRRQVHAARDRVDAADAHSRAGALRRARRVSGRRGAAPTPWLARARPAALPRADGAREPEVLRRAAWSADVEARGRRGAAALRASRVAGGRSRCRASRAACASGWPSSAR